jgi:hypothetical protein
MKKNETSCLQLLLSFGVPPLIESQDKICEHCSMLMAGSMAMDIF